MRPVRLEIEGLTSFRDRVSLDFDGLDLFAITGPTGELIMHAFGRRDHALVLVDPPGSALEG